MQFFAVFKCFSLFFFYIFRQNHIVFKMFIIIFYRIGDASKATVNSKNISSFLKDKHYLDKDFTQFLRDRFYKVVELKGSTASISAANAIKDHLRDWHFGTKPGEHVTMGVLTDKNPYGIKNGLIFSFPVTVKNGTWSIVKGYRFSKEMKAMIKETESEIEVEIENACKIV